MVEVDLCGLRNPLGKFSLSFSTNTIYTFTGLPTKAYLVTGAKFIAMNVIRLEKSVQLADRFLNLNIRTLDELIRKSKAGCSGSAQAIPVAIDISGSG